MVPDLKLISWNVNGLRAIWKKGFVETVRSLEPDILALQETKIQPDQITDDMKDLDGYTAHWSCAKTKKGYSGVAVYTRIPPVSVKSGIGQSVFDDEGRILELDFNDFVFFNIYFPNGQMGEDRLQYKLDFYEALFDHLEQYRAAGRRIVICGDFNTAHNEIDLKNPKANENTSGFMRVERDWIDRIIEKGYVDTFRTLYPDKVQYSWWSYRFRARERNAGWRLDYFFVSRNLMDAGAVRDAVILDQIMGSDHCPVALFMNLREKD